VQDARGVIARDPFGLCWRTGYWTPADAVPGCDLPSALSQRNWKTANAWHRRRHQPRRLPQGTGSKTSTEPGTVPTAQKVSFAADAFFDFDKSVLKPEGKAKLDDLTSKLGSINLEVIIAVGHTDSVGPMSTTRSCRYAALKQSRPTWSRKALKPTACTPKAKARNSQ
jgi:OOP family OmpA-OmpF porin